MDEPIIFRLSRPGRVGVDIHSDINELKIESKDCLPQEWLRDNEVENLPEVNEFDVIRHYTRISQWNYFVDAHFYPLGSCTMKYNPRVNEKIASMDCFADIHPYQNEDDIQGILQVIWESQEWLKKLSGMDAVSMQPAAGAQGELTSLLMFQAYHRAQGRQRKIILVPDSAHGTNPASATIAGFEVHAFKSNANGLIDMASFQTAVEEVGSNQLAGVMITNPNTLGFFEPNIKDISRQLEAIDALLYIDGANFNAILGVSHYGLMGADAVHFNLHKTFATPHGGGGPGAGPIGVSAKLAPFLPGPLVEQYAEGLYSSRIPLNSIGKVKSYFGNMGVIIKALAYMKALGNKHASEVAYRAVANANYIKARLSPYLSLPFSGDNLHEVVFSEKKIKADYGITAYDLAKALLDKGFHAPTIYFPLIVSGAIMIEPTESESKATLDQFCDAVIDILELAKKDKDYIKQSPKNQRVNRLDEVAAARSPILHYFMESDVG